MRHPVAAFPRMGCDGGREVGQKLTADKVRNFLGAYQSSGISLSCSEVVSI